RPVAPVGVTSVGTPCTSLMMRSGWMAADPLVPTMSNQNRSPSARWRQLTSTEKETPFSHTTRTEPISSTLSAPPCRSTCAEMRLGAGHPESHRPRSSSVTPRSSTAPPPDSWRRWRQVGSCRAGVAQHVLDVVVRIRHLEAGGERLSLRGVVVADRRDLDARQAPQRREMRDLGNGPGAHHHHANRVAHRAPTQRYRTPALKP